MTDSNDSRLPVNQKLLTRLFSKIKISTEHFYKGDPCWEWTAATHPDGYGIFGNLNSPNNFGTQRAHRLMFQFFVHKLHNTQQLCDHLCRVRHCVNPAHIEIVTPKDNVLRGKGYAAVNAQKTHCKRGHSLSGDNLYIAPPRKNSRQSYVGIERGCKTCRNNAAIKVKRQIPPRKAR